MTYDAWRENGGPTLYDANKNPVTVDVLEIGLIYAILILTVSFILTLPGFGGKSIITTSIKCFFGLFITGLIILCNFGQEWEVAEIHTVTQYRAGLREEIEADIGVKIGLRSVNITLKATPDKEVEFANGTVKETINYNERFHWDSPGWVQGRAGFGPFAGLVNREYRAGQRKGLPYPILWIAEYFTIDGEGIRWGRYYRQAGFYAHTMMWLAFPIWILSMILMHIVVRYGGYMSILTSILLFTVNIIYACVRNPLELKVPFEDEVLEFHWGWCFWLNIVNGFLCFLIGLILVLADALFYEKAVNFFGLDILSDYEEIYADPNEIAQIAAGVLQPASKSMKKKQTLRREQRPEGASSGAKSDVSSPPPYDEHDSPHPPPIPQKRQYRKRQQFGASRKTRTRDIESSASHSRTFQEASNTGQDLYEMEKPKSNPNRV